MRKLNCSVSLFLVILFLCTTAFASGTVHTTGSVNIRTGPGLDYSSMGSVSSGTSLSYCDESCTDYRGVVWYEVAYRGSCGWVSSKYSWLEADYDYDDSDDYGDDGLSYDRDDDVTYVRATAVTGVRKGPGSSYGRYNTLQKGEQVEYLGEERRDSEGNLWYKVRYYSYGDGWVNADKSVLVTSGSEGVSKSGTRVSGSYVEATGGKSNLRSQPDLDGSIRCTFPSGATAEYLGNYSYDERGVLWYYIDYDGIVGWVSSRYTTLY